MDLKAAPLQKITTAQTACLKLTPQMRQAIHVLQLPVLELKNYLEKELILNPVLEEDLPLNPEIPKPQVSALKGDTLDWLTAREDESGFGRQAGLDEESAKKRDYFMQNFLGKPVFLEEHLLGQAGLLGFSQSQMRIAVEITGNLNEDGYLFCPLSQIAESLNVSLEEVQRVLGALQRLDPPGIAARDLRESLLIQMDLDPAPQSAPEKILARKIVQDHFDDLKKRKFKKIAASLKTSAAEISRALSFIRKLNPRPAMGFRAENPRYVVPDVVLQPLSDGFKINCRESEMRLKINPAYQKLLKDKKTPRSLKKYLREKLNAGLHLIKAVDEREKTIEKIVRWSAGAQAEFFAKGPGHLKPFTLEQAAALLGFHKSTLSRALSDKYIQTPHGTFELKKLFSAAVGSGDQVSSASDIQNKVQILVKTEDKKKPLSDDKIVQQLKLKGVQVARRTVAKYRHLLRILPAHLRKESWRRVESG